MEVNIPQIIAFSFNLPRLALEGLEANQDKIRKFRHDIDAPGSVLGQHSLPTEISDPVAKATWYEAATAAEVFDTSVRPPKGIIIECDTYYSLKDTGFADKRQQERNQEALGQYALLHLSEEPIRSIYAIWHFDSLESVGFQVVEDLLLSLISRGSSDFTANMILAYALEENPEFYSKVKRKPLVKSFIDRIS